MRKWLGPLALCAVLALITHASIVHFAPALIMDRAFTMLEQRGTPLHGFQLAPRMTPETQSVVRPSPDLAYSACRFDLAEAANGIRVQMAAYEGYSSLSFFDAKTNNFLTIRGDGKNQDITLTSESSPSSKGIVLIRRLAPNAEDYAKVIEVAQKDACEAL